MGNSKLKVGDRFQAFELLNQAEENCKIFPGDGQKRIIYFYPKDDTKVCTAQACSMQDNMAEFTGLGYEVIGISGDSPSSHQRFMANNNLNFLLLSDPQSKVRKQFGVGHLFGLLPGRKHLFLMNKENLNLNMKRCLKVKNTLKK